MKHSIPTNPFRLRGLEEGSFFEDVWNLKNVENLFQVFLISDVLWRVYKAFLSTDVSIHFYIFLWEVDLFFGFNFQHNIVLHVWKLEKNYKMVQGDKWKIA